MKTAIRSLCIIVCMFAVGCSHYRAEMITYNGERYLRVSNDGEHEHRWVGVKIRYLAEYNSTTFKTGYGHEGFAVERRDGKPAVPAHHSVLIPRSRIREVRDLTGVKDRKGQPVKDILVKIDDYGNGDMPYRFVFSAWKGIDANKMKTIPNNQF